MAAFVDHALVFGPAPRDARVERVVRRQSVDAAGRLLADPARHAQHAALPARRSDRSGCLGNWFRGQVSQEISVSRCSTTAGQ